MTPSIRGQSNKKAQISENGRIVRQDISKNQFGTSKEDPGDESPNNGSEDSNAAGRSKVLTLVRMSVTCLRLRLSSGMSLSTKPFSSLKTWNYRQETMQEKPKYWHECTWFNPSWTKPTEKRSIVSDRKTFNQNVFFRNNDLTSNSIILKPVLRCIWCKRAILSAKSNRDTNSSANIRTRKGRCLVWLFRVIIVAFILMIK